MILRIISTIMMLSLMAVAVSGQHWQSSDGPVPLFIDSNLVRVKLLETPTDEALSALLSRSDDLVKVELILVN